MGFVCTLFPGLCSQQLPTTSLTSRCVKNGQNFFGGILGVYVHYGYLYTGPTAFEGGLFFEFETGYDGKIFEPAYLYCIGLTTSLVHVCEPHTHTIRGPI